MSARSTVNTVEHVDAKIQLDITVLRKIVNGSMGSRAVRFTDWRDAMASHEPLEALRERWRLYRDLEGQHPAIYEVWQTAIRELDAALAASAEPPKYRFAGNLKPQPYDAEPASTPAPELPLKHEFEAAPECYMCGKSWWEHQLLEARVAELEAALARITPAKEKQ